MVPTPEVAQRTGPRPDRAAASICANVRARRARVPTTSTGVCITPATGAMSRSGSYDTVETCGTSESAVMAEKHSVRPSGSARASTRIATAPPAPGRCSTCTGTPRRASSLCASTRVISSLTPPGG